MKTFMIGIGGIAMCGVAGILKKCSFEVAGSEKDTIYPPASEILKKLKIPVFRFNPENIRNFRPDTVIVGNAIKKDHPEVLEAEKLKIPMYSFPMFLERFLFSEKKILVCAGTHGKTTTTALLSYVLEKAELDPGYLVGGVLKHNVSNFRKGSGPFFIIEGDEYPSSFFDRAPKFLHYKPFALILTSLEFDHADVYPDLNSLKKVFKELINMVPEEGIVIYNQDDANLKEVISTSSLKARCVSYGTTPEADFCLMQSITEFKDKRFINRVKIRTNSKEVMEFCIGIPGRYNALNALSVFALLHYLSLLDSKVIEALKEFTGVKRRQEVIYADDRLIIIDDFAHHPTAVKKTLKELKSIIKPKLTVLVFEPRTNSSKRKVFQKEYEESLSLADVVFLKEPPGLDAIPKSERIDLCHISQSLKNKGKKVYFLSKSKDLLKDQSERTLLVFMSSAYFEEEVTELLKTLKL